MFTLSVVYGHNLQSMRKSLWTDIITAGQNLNIPWLVIGESEIQYGKGWGKHIPDRVLQDFNNSLDFAALREIPSVGHTWSWSNRAKTSHRIMCKLDRWWEAMQEEMESLHKNHTFELVQLPKGEESLEEQMGVQVEAGKQELTTTLQGEGVKGFEQKKGIDFEEIFSPVVKMTFIRVVLSLAASMDLEVEQLDVKTAFLHGDLEEEIYMVQPEGFAVRGKENLVCRLRKSLYGLKQAPRQWYKKFDSFMVEHGYNRTASDHCVFVKRFSSNSFLILLLYVDDMLIVGKVAYWSLSFFHTQ